MGSSPIFPILNKCYWNSYVINNIKLNLSKKNLRFFLIFNKTNIKILHLLKNLGIILHFTIFIKAKKILILIYINYFKNINIFNVLKIISKPKHSYIITYDMLKLLNKKNGNSLYILWHHNKMITHKLALNLRLGGKLIFFIQ